MRAIRGAVRGLRLVSTSAALGTPAVPAVSVPHKPSSSQTTPMPKPGTAHTDKELQFDQVTHTGQAWDPEDYRLARFTDTEKQVNPNVAMHLVAASAPIAVKGRVAVCDGGGGALGHPKVYINLDKPGVHVCGYCGRRYYQEDLALDAREAAAMKEYIQV